MTERQYVIEWPTATKNEVNAWAVQYTAYEPKDWRRDMRDELKQAIGEISNDYSVLYARYVSESNLKCDAENVLLYNIGAPAFKDLCKNGLCFERGSHHFRKPNFAMEMNHYYHYSQRNEFVIWREDEVLAWWREIEFPTPKSTSKPHLFWKEMKEGQKKGQVNCSHPKVTPNKFGLDITLNIPNNVWCNLAVLIKPLLDGVISAFHRHDVPDDKTILERLAGLTGFSVAEAERLLCEELDPILGARKLVWAFKQTIQWNPADDACVACKVKIERSANNTSWSMDGKLFTVKGGMVVDELDQERLENEDWTKATWDLPPYRSAEFDLLLLTVGTSLEKFKTLPVYKFAVKRGVIVDDKWVGVDHIMRPLRRKPQT